ncbi:hypothetical protein [Paenibacillus sonchi]|nr:hypothetical protein [Paenibacillus sonchi]
MKFQKTAIALTSLALLLGAGGTAMAATPVFGETGLYPPSKQQLQEHKEIIKQAEAIQQKKRQLGEIEYIYIKNMTQNLPEGFDYVIGEGGYEAFKDYAALMERAESLGVPQPKGLIVPEGYQFTGGAIQTHVPQSWSAENEKVLKQLRVKAAAAGKKFYTEKTTQEKRKDIRMSYAKGKTQLSIAIEHTDVQSPNVEIMDDPKSEKPGELTIAGQKVTYTGGASLPKGSFPATQHYVRWNDKDANLSYRVWARDNGLSKQDLIALAEQLINAQ